MRIDSQAMGENPATVRSACTGVIRGDVDDVGGGSPVQLCWEALSSSDLDNREAPDETVFIHSREDEVSPLSKFSQLAEWVRNVHVNAFGHCGRPTETYRGAQCNHLVGDFLAESDTN